MSLKTKRPKGITIFTIIYLLDAIASAIFIGFYVGMKDFVAMIDQSALDFGTGYRILDIFIDYPVESLVIVIVIDILAVIGLLSTKTWARKLVIACTISGMILNGVTFGIPGFIVNIALLWYVFRQKTKEYFQIAN